MKPQKLLMNSCHFFTFNVWRPRYDKVKSNFLSPESSLHFDRKNFSRNTMRQEILISIANGILLQLRFDKSELYLWWYFYFLHIYYLKRKLICFSCFINSRSSKLGGFRSMVHLSEKCTYWLYSLTAQTDFTYYT